MNAYTKQVLVAIVILLNLCSGLGAQEIDVRLSIKYILNNQYHRPTGFYATEQNIRDVIDATNRTMKRWGRGYRFVIVGNIEEVSETTAPGSSAFFVLDPNSELGTLEDAAVANPAGYFWRNDAVNVYIVNCCAAAAAIPSIDVDRRAVYFSADVNNAPCDPGQNARQVVWSHELGHHFNLIHPWNNDGVVDTRPEPSPKQCFGSPPLPPPCDAFPCTLGGSTECCCSTKVNNLFDAMQSGGWSQTDYDNLRYNVMGYMAAVDCVPLGEDMITIDTMRLTDGQLDRWTDATRQYHANEVSGLTYFVDQANTSAPFNGYSSDSYRTVADGVTAATQTTGNIALIRSGSYNETLTVTSPVTLRSSRGPVTIGQ